MTDEEMVTFALAGMTQEEKDVLAHIVENPQAWYAHCVVKFGLKSAKQMLKAKVKRWRSKYEQARNLPGYQTRAERERAKQ